MQLSATYEGTVIHPTTRAAKRSLACRSDRRLVLRRMIFGLATADKASYKKRGGTPLPVAFSSGELPYFR